MQKAQIASLKYFVPCRNIWLKRFILLFSFILFDYIATLIFCNAPSQEANIYARAFMEAFGKEAGLTIFNAITTAPLYLIFSVDSHLVRLPPKIARMTNPAVDVTFAWFIAGVRFNGATSWFWSATPIFRQALGASLYLTLLFFIFAIPQLAEQGKHSSRQTIIFNSK